MGLFSKYFQPTSPSIPIDYSNICIEIAHSFIANEFFDWSREQRLEMKEFSPEIYQKYLGNRIESYYIANSLLHILTERKLGKKINFLDEPSLKKTFREMAIHLLKSEEVAKSLSEYMRINMEGFYVANDPISWVFWYFTYRNTKYLFDLEAIYDLFCYFKAKGMPDLSCNNIMEILSNKVLDELKHESEYDDEDIEEEMNLRFVAKVACVINAAEFYQQPLLKDVIVTSMGEINSAIFFSKFEGLVNKHLRFINQIFSSIERFPKELLKC